MISSNRNIKTAPRRSTFMLANEGPLSQDLLLRPGDFGLGMLPEKLNPNATTNMVCGFCATGCGLTVHLNNEQAVNLTPNSASPVNLGMACPKGWEALSVLKSDDRATQPLSRMDRTKSFRPLDWNSAAQEFCNRFKAIQKKYGKHSIAFLSTGQIATEEMAMLGSLTKFGMGMLHGDGNTRQCMATAVVAYKQAFGFDAPGYTYQDFEESDVIVLVGSNLCVAHPIMWQRICQNKHNCKIIVVDPRKTETAMAASHHLAIQPKSDLVLFYGLANRLIQQKWIAKEFINNYTNDFDDFKQFVSQYSPEVVSNATGIDPFELHEIARIIHQGKRVSFWWTMGVNQSYEGVRTAQSIINLALMTGNIGKPGTGANSITGQCNAMGSRLFSNTTNLLGGHEFTNEIHRQKVAQILNIDPRKIPNENSWSYNEIIEGILKNKIKGLWIIGTNTAHSWINQNTCREILDRLDFLVVQDMYHNTETVQLADLVLPAAGWGEKDGTFINSERRISLIKKVARAPGQSLSDFSIFKLIAHHWGCGKMFEKWQQPEDVFQSLKEITKGQPCDITGIRDYKMIDQHHGIQWPYPLNEDEPPTSAGASRTSIPNAEQKNISSHRRLYADHKFYHPDGRAKFIFENPRLMPEMPVAKYPYLLLTGRGTAAQWHTQTRSRQSAVLRTLYPAAVYVEINPLDARREKIKPNQLVAVQSQRGTIRARARVTPTIAQGQLFLPMHYVETNKLTHAHFDPYSKQPSYKDCAVRVRAIESWDE